MNDLKNIDLSQLRGTFFKDSKQMGVNLDQIRIEPVRDFLNSPISINAGINNLITVRDLNAKLDGTIIPLTMIFSKTDPFKMKDTINLLAGGKWWNINSFGMSDVFKAMVEIKTKGGLHARPMNDIIKAANGFSSTINIYNSKGDKGDAKSMTSLSMLMIGEGQSVTLEVEGSDAEAAFNMIIKMLQSPTLGARK